MSDPIEKRGRKVFGFLQMPSDHVTNTLEASEYKRHTNGFVRDLDYRKRFHAIETKDGVEIHLDLTAPNGKHYVANWVKFLSLEIRRIRKIYQALHPKGPTTTESKRRKNVFAPNAYELQKSFRTPLPKRGSLLARLVRLFW